MKRNRQIRSYVIGLSCVIVFIFCPFIYHIIKVSQVLDNHQIDALQLEREKLRSRSIKLLDQIKIENNILNDIHENKLNNQISNSNEINNAINSNEHIKINKNPNHPILYLSDEEFKSISIGKMMSWYGEADGGGSCAIDFGNQLVNRWRDTKKEYCHSYSSNKEISKAQSSSMDCYLVRQTRHHGSGDNICLMHDVSINMKIFSDKEITSSVVKQYVSSSHFDQPYIKFPEDFVTAHCQTDESLWKAQFMPGWNVDWSYNGFNSVSDINNDKLQCNDRENHNILIIQRDTFANFFHDSEDFVNAFLTMAVLDWNLMDTQLYLTDLYPEGPFWDMWSQVYGAGRPVMTAWDLKNKYEDNKYDTNGRTCFDNIAIGIYGPAAPITVASWDTSCRKTALVRAYSDFIIRGLNLQSKTFYLLDKPKNTILVTYMARRASIEWPEKKFCSNDNNFFNCEYWNNFGIRKLGRMIQNEVKLLSSLKELEKKQYNGYSVIIQDVDYNLLSITKQIENDIITDIMIGPHGAGLMHNIFMPDNSALIELFVDGSSGNRHFHNLAFWYGRKYNGLTTSNPVDVNQIVNTVNNVINDMVKV